MSSGAHAIVAAHGDLAAGLVSAVAQITGRGELFLPLTNLGRGAGELERVLREEIERTGAAVVFTDLPAGSWTTAARRVQRERPGLVLVTGANLAMLLDFALRGERQLADAVRTAVEKGRDAMLLVGAPGGH